METNGKSIILQRTLGAAVLIAAAATLVPLVLDGEGLKASREQVQIPDEPTFELQLDEHQQPKVRMLQAKGAIERTGQEAIDAVSAADAGNGGVDAAGVAPDAGAGLGIAGTVTTNPTAATEAGLATTSTTVTAAPDSSPAGVSPSEKSVSLPSEPTSAGQSMEDVIQKLTQTNAQPMQPKAAQAPMPATSQPAAMGGDVADSWTIQMGAFKDRINADKVVAQLVSHGYRAYLGSQTPGVYRVFVGPEIRRDRADQLRDRVAADTGTRGVVIRYVP